MPWKTGLSQCTWVSVAIPAPRRSSAISSRNSMRSLTNSSRSCRSFCVSKYGCPLNAGSKSQMNSSSDAPNRRASSLALSSAGCAAAVGSTMARMRSRRFMALGLHQYLLMAQVHCGFRRAQPQFGEPLRKIPTRTEHSRLSPCDPGPYHCAVRAHCTRNAGIEFHPLEASMNTTATYYNDKVVRQFAIMTVVWGIVGMLVGVLIAAQLLWPALNFDVPWLTYSRLRPLHTNAVIFAFGGSALFATSYYAVQRTCHVRLFGGQLAALTFWGWQLVILLAAITLPLGYTTGKEYAELEWPIDILIAVVWVSYAIVFFGTLATRKVKHIYVANWFFGAFILTVAILHIVNSMAVPASFLKSYSAYPGAIDAMVQWWYGHNAVGFFLTAGFLGIMYYFIPKAAGRPVYSYRLSVVHFWALIFTYMWAGPHHLHYTALPEWAQSLGMVFSLILLAPSWGGMINGIMTLSGAWH